MDTEKQVRVSTKGQSIVSSTGHGTGPKVASSSRDESEGDVNQEPGFLNNIIAGGVEGTLNGVLSKISMKSSWNPGAPPDGGSKAWLMCKLFYP